MAYDILYMVYILKFQKQKMKEIIKKALISLALLAIQLCYVVAIYHLAKTMSPEMNIALYFIGLVGSVFIFYMIFLVLNKTAG